MNSIVGAFLILACLNAFADGIEYREVTASTADPVDQPPVLKYGEEVVPKLAPPQPMPAAQRAPANVNPIRYVDSELGVACYYILPAPVPTNIVPPGSPVISCVKLETKKASPPPVELPASQTK